jgi:hypothetical protein
VVRRGAPDDETRVVRRGAPDDETRVVRRGAPDDETRVVRRDAPDDETRVVARGTAEHDTRLVRGGSDSGSHPVNSNASVLGSQRRAPAADGIPVVSTRKPLVPGGVSDSPSDVYGIRDQPIPMAAVPRRIESGPPARDLRPVAAEESDRAAGHQGRRRAIGLIIGIVVGTLVLAAVIGGALVIVLRSNG